MNRSPSLLRRGFIAFAPALSVILASGLQTSQAAEPWDWSQQTSLPPNLNALLAATDNADSSSRPNPIRLFGMTTARPTDPVGLDQDDFNPANPGVPETTPGPDGDNTADWFTVAIGNDNPYLEFRQRGDPGGTGYYRMATQVQVIDCPTSACCLGFQAYTPAGLQQGGVATGPTTFCPNLAVCQQLDDGVALHAFVGQNLQLDQRLAASQLRQRIQYGVAVQQPLFTDVSDRTDNFYFFVQALGRYRYDASQVSSYAPGAPAASLQVLPGLQWKASDNLWWSSGFAVPVGGSTNRFDDSGHLQFTCMFRF